MHDHDLDLIAAYADGTLTDDTSHAERLVASCEVCRAEYERQRQVRDLLRGLAPVRMAEAERARLHEAVWSRIEARREVVPPAPSRVPRRVPWWLRLAPVAAGVLVVVVGLGVLLQTGGGVESAAEPDVAADLPATTAAAAAPSATTLAPPVGGQSAPEDQAFAEMVEEAAPVPSPDLRRMSPGVDLGETTIDEIEAVLEDLAKADTVTTAEPAPLPACFDRLDGEPLAMVFAVLDGEPVEAYLVGDAATTEVVVFVLPDCTPLPG